MWSQMIKAIKAVCWQVPFCVAVHWRRLFVSIRCSNRPTHHQLMAHPKRVCIVGGGASGSACAYALSRHPESYNVTLFDKEPHPGGMATSIAIDQNKYGQSTAHHSESHLFLIGSGRAILMTAFKVRTLINLFYPMFTHHPLVQRMCSHFCEHNQDVPQTRLRVHRSRNAVRSSPPARVLITKTTNSLG